MKQYERRAVRQRITELEQWLRESERTKARYGSGLSDVSGLDWQGFNGSADQVLMPTMPEAPRQIQPGP